MESNLFTDYSEYIVGIPSLIISILVAIWVYTKQIRKKKLSVSIYSRNIISVYNEEIKNDLVISYKGNVIEELFLSSITFKNIGNVPIKKDDFESDILIELKDDDKTDILFSKIQYKVPNDLNVKMVKVEGKNIEIGKLLINPNEVFDLNIVTNRRPNIKISTRIAGVERILKNENYFYIAISFGETFIIAIALIANLLVLEFSSLFVLSIPFTIFSILILIREVFKELEEKRKKRQKGKVLQQK